MIATRDIHGKIGKKAFTILEGRLIPAYLVKHLDIKRLKAEGVIVDEKEPPSKKLKETFRNDRSTHSCGIGFTENPQ